LLLFLLISFELIKIFTNGNSKVAILGALMITFAPAIQWWFIPHIADVFFWSMCLTVFGYKFFTEKKQWKKYIFVVFLSLSVCTFVMALFPGLQVPLGLFSLASLLCLLIRDKKLITTNKKQIIIAIILMLVIVIPILGYTLYTSYDAIMATMNTVYPGSRLELGGNRNYQVLFTNLTNIFLPYKSITYLNESEISDFLHLGILCLMVYPFILKKLRKSDSNELIIGNLFIIVMAIEIIFMLVGFPEWLAKLTLFKYINRMHLVYGFTSCIFTLWTINILFKHKDIIGRKSAIIIGLVYSILYYKTIDQNMLGYMPRLAYIAEIAGIFLLVICILFRYKKETFELIAIIVLFSGFTINPIAIGISPITNHEFVNFIKNHNDGYYITLDSNVTQNLLLANGVKTLNAINFYPDYGKWKLIDSNGENDNFYNRYAHIEIELTSEETNYKLMNADWIVVNLNYSDLKKLGIKYIFTNSNKLIDFSKYDINASVDYSNSEEGVIIYEIYN